jgi:hypothetical protein
VEEMKNKGERQFQEMVEEGRDRGEQELRNKVQEGRDFAQRNLTQQIEVKTSFLPLVYLSFFQSNNDSTGSQNRFFFKQSRSTKLFKSLITIS